MIFLGLDFLLPTRRALPMASRGNGPADTAPPARFASLHGQPEAVLSQAATGPSRPAR
jgi:hypothetical protein